MAEAIRIIGATTHNLQSVTCELPAGALIVVTGPSGSGKSSLIFETLYREAVRQVVAPALSSPRLLRQRASVAQISGLSFPVLFLSGSPNRSLLPSAAILSGCYSAIIELFLHEGKPACLECGSELRADSRSQMLSWIAALPQESVVEIVAPVTVTSAQELQRKADELLSSGFSRMSVDGETLTLESVQRLADDLVSGAFPELGVIVDLVPLAAKRADARIAAALALALKLGDGEVRVRADAQDMLFSETLTCRKCGLRQRPVSTKDYVHTRRAGSCERCSGAGLVLVAHEAGVIASEEPLIAGGIIPWRNPASKPAEREIQKFADALKLTEETRWADLSPKARDRVLFGKKGRRDFRRFGVRNSVESADLIESGVCGVLFEKALAGKTSRFETIFERAFFEKVCPSCNGARVGPEAAARRLGALSFGQFYTGSLRAADDALAAREQTRAVVAARRAFEPALALGIDYLELARPAPKLSTGEYQRLQLARELRSSLEKLLFFFDEPSRGLHPLEIGLVTHAFRALTERSSTVIVVDHDPQIVRGADHVIRLGPGSGVDGGRIVSQGSPDAAADRAESARPKETPRPSAFEFLNARGLTAHNLKSVDLDLPLGALTAVCGRSGSGKSTALLDVLAPSLNIVLARRSELTDEERRVLGIAQLSGWESLRRVVVTGASSNFRAARSSVGSATGIIPLLRELYARATEAKIFGLTAASFTPENIHAGRVAFKGLSYERARSFNIVQALAHFGNIPQIARRLRLLVDLGLGYLCLAQPARSLSSGEQQRLRLFVDLARSSDDLRTLYIFDEPTRGIDREQISKLIGIARGLCGAGHTVVMIEHNLQVIAESDYVLELGPGGGENGGSLISHGAPNEIRSTEHSLIGRFL